MLYLLGVRLFISIAEYTFLWSDTRNSSRRVFIYLSIYLKLKRKFNLRYSVFVNLFDRFPITASSDCKYLGGGEIG